MRLYSKVDSKSVHVQKVEEYFLASRTVFNKLNRNKAEKGGRGREKVSREILFTDSFLRVFEEKTIFALRNTRREKRRVPVPN